MNVFVLGTGRCGTTTFMRACRHVTSHTTAHESRINLVGPDKLSYPPNHIESDNRLSWFLGRLEEAYGDDAVYIHMTRDEEEVARSYLKRAKVEQSIAYGYRTSLIPNPDPSASDLDLMRDMCRTVNANIRVFLKDKSRTAHVRLEHAEEDFDRCWDIAGFEGDRAAALAEWRVSYNASRPPAPTGLAKLKRMPAKLGRIAAKFPDFIDRA